MFAALGRRELTALVATRWNPAAFLGMLMTAGAPDMITMPRTMGSRACATRATPSDEAPAE